MMLENYLRARLKMKLPGIIEQNKMSPIPLKDGYLKSHIPNSIFLDLSHDLTDKKSHLSFMLPTENEFSYYISEAGINNNHDIILKNKYFT